MGTRLLFATALKRPYSGSPYGQLAVKIIGLTVLVAVVVAGWLVFRSLHLRPCVAARAIFESYGDVSGYGSFQGMLAGDFRHLGGHEFIYIEIDAHPSRTAKVPRAKYVNVLLGFFSNDFQRMSVPVSEFYSSKGKPLTCGGGIN